MATFSVRGEQNGQAVTVTWTDGALSGDTLAVQRVRDLAREYEGRAVRLAPWIPTLHNHLSNPYSAYRLMTWIFPGRPELIGELPRVEIPEGEIL